MHHAFVLHPSLKLTTKYYGSFKILECIGQTAYRLQLSKATNINPFFHVSQLKKNIGPKTIPQINLPLVTSDGYIKTDPIAVLETRALPRRDEIMIQLRIQWQNLFEDHDTWEHKVFIKATFPDFYFKTLKKWWPSSDPRRHGSS
jgi:hypothetical protein